MKRNQSFRSAAPLWAALSIPVLWLCLLLATAYESGAGLGELLERFNFLLAHPFSLQWKPHSLRFLLLGLGAYGMAITMYYSTRQNRRPGEEYGSAKWGDPKALCRKYADRKQFQNNVIMTARFRISFDSYAHRRNLNTVVIGNSGAGKSRFSVKPWLYSANCSYIVTDPKGELLRASGHLLKARGYEIAVFNLSDPAQSDGYNPFAYIHNDADVPKLVDNLIRNTTPEKSSAADGGFWEKSESNLLSALILYLHYEAPAYEQTLEMITYLIASSHVKEEDEAYESPVDILFRELEDQNPNHPAVRQYQLFKNGAGKTAKSILISAGVRLASLALPQYATITSRDDMDFRSLGERKRAIFCVTPVADSSMNYLVGMLYTQCFQELYRVADEKYGGRLPVPVRIIQDEWANVPQPDSYPKILATCRSYNISINIIVQNIGQIKSMYEKEWETIVGNCDTLLFLGAGNETSSLEFMSKLLGKETLDTRTRGVTRGHSGSSSTNFQQAGRELMTPEEIRLLDTHDCILLVRGEKPVFDRKYDLMRHPNIRYTTDGGGKPYIHKTAPTRFELADLPYEFYTLEDYQFETLEESEHEKPDELDQNAEE